MKKSIICSAILFGALAVVALTDNKPGYYNKQYCPNATYRSPDRTRAVEKVDPSGLEFKNPVVLAAINKINAQLPLVTD